MTLDVQSVLIRIFEENLLIEAQLSGPRTRLNQALSKVTIRPVQVKKNFLYQVSEQVGQQVRHRNVGAGECGAILQNHYIGSFKQIILYTSEADYYLFINRRGEIQISTKKASKLVAKPTHNKSKNYLLVEGSPIPFLVELGLMNDLGKVYPQKMHKFRQINRYLEMVDDILPSFEFPNLHIVDFGCGKAYLTFALYYFLHVIRGWEVSLVGLDLKTDLIVSCQELALKLGWTGLSFSVGDIIDYSPKQQVDLVVALHACDLATDQALAKGILWQAKVILAAPCCQHELYQQVTSKPLEALLTYGILKERFAALVTDAVRAKLLESYGYRTQVLEFIDSEHTPKNLLIRASRGNTPSQREYARQRYHAIKQALKISPTLEQLLSW